MKPFLDTKIRKSQEIFSFFTDGKLGKSGLKWKLDAGIYGGGTVLKLAQDKIYKMLIGLLLKILIWMSY